MPTATSGGSQSSVGRTRRMISADSIPHLTRSPHQFLRGHAPLFRTDPPQQLRLPTPLSFASYLSTYVSKHTALARHLSLLPSRRAIPQLLARAVVQSPPRYPLRFILVSPTIYCKHLLPLSLRTPHIIVHFRTTSLARIATDQAFRPPQSPHALFKGKTLSWKGPKERTVPNQ